MVNPEFLYNTDFLAAIRKNKRNSIIIIIALIFIMMILGYLIGFYLETHYAKQYSVQYNPRNAFIARVPIQNNIPRTIFEISNWGFTASLIACAISILWASIAIFSGDKVILFAAGAKPISHDEAPMLYNVVDEMAIAAGIPPPKAYIIETDAPNAFATGMSPQNAYVAITRGLLNDLNRDELQGVIAHEIGHIINYDIRYQTVVTIMVGLIVLLSDFARRTIFYGEFYGHSRSRSSSKNNSGAGGMIVLILLVFSIIAPIAALLLQMAASRQREYMADATSVKLTRNPLGLISALKKLGALSKPFDGANRATQSMFIVNPFRNVAKRTSNLFSTHPPLEDRIKRLQNLDK